MKIKYKLGAAEIDWLRACEVIKLAKLSPRKPSELKKAFSNSYACVFAYSGREIVGLGRLLSDGVYQAAIYDVAILPQYQGMGIGRKIMRKLCRSVKVKNIILYSVTGKEGFYSKCGFRKMRTAMGKLDPKWASKYLI